MKIELNVKDTLKIAAVVFTVVAFFMIFAAPVIYYNGLFVYTSDMVYFGKMPDIGEAAKPITLPVIGFILILVGGLGIGSTLFIKSKIERWLLVGYSVLIVLGAVFVVLVKSLFVQAYDMSFASNMFNLGAGPILAIIFSALAVVCVIVPEFIKFKK